MIDISVVIPTYDSAADLRKCLDALLTSKFDPSRFEIIVVDDGSTDDTEAVVSEYMKRPPPIIRYLKRDRKNGYGSGIARNDGIALAAGRVIAATDADCVVDPAWLAAIADAVFSRHLALVSGDVRCDDVLLFPWKMSPAGHLGVTANLAYDTKQVGSVPFSQGFDGMLGDDKDFIYRVGAAGHTLTHVPGMRVCHPPRVMSLRQVISRSKWRKNEVLLVKRHGRQALANMNVFFRPLIAGRISPATVAGALAPASLLLAVVRPLLFVRAVLPLAVIGALAFIAYGYRFAITYVPEGGGRVTIGERCKTLAFIVAYIPCFIAARVIGSVQYRFLLL